MSRLGWRWNRIKNASYYYFIFRVRSLFLRAIYPFRRKRICYARSPQKLGNHQCFLTLNHTKYWHADESGYIWRDNGTWSWQGPWEDLPVELRDDPKRNKSLDWIHEYE